MASQNPPSLSDPRLDKPAHYNRDEIVSDLQSFYTFLPHVDPSSVHLAPPGGWGVITPESFAKHGIYKTDEVISLLRQLPYIEGVQPWIMTSALSCDYRLVDLDPTARSKPGWLFDVADKQWPPWVVQLTAGTDREGHCYMLDTTDGTITRYCNGGFEYPPTYAEGETRSWRDRFCDPETKTLKDMLEEWRGMYRNMTILGVPQPTDPLVSSPEIYYRLPQAGPGDWNFEENEVSILELFFVFLYSLGRVK
jgi:hypothetical protein